MAKQLYRSNHNRILGGVCGGLGEYFNVDPGIIRVVFIILALPGGFPGIVPYAAIWLFVPVEPKSNA